MTTLQNLEIGTIVRIADPTNKNFEKLGVISQPETLLDVSVTMFTGSNTGYVVNYLPETNVLVISETSLH